jgi:hypothetical protein
VFSTTNTDKHVAEIGKVIAPQGRFALIDDPASLESVSEFMVRVRGGG